MTYYAAIDTNVIVSAMLKAGSTPDEVVQLALKGHIIPLVNKEILTLEKVKELLKNRFSTVDYKSAKDDAKNFISDESSLDIWGKELFLSTLQELKAN